MAFHQLLQIAMSMLCVCDVLHTTYPTNGYHLQPFSSAVTLWHGSLAADARAAEAACVVLQRLLTATPHAWNVFKGLSTEKFASHTALANAGPVA